MRRTISVSIEGSSEGQAIACAQPASAPRETIEPYFAEVPAWAVKKVWSDDPSWKGLVHFPPGAPPGKTNVFPWGLLRINLEGQGHEVFQGFMESCKTVSLNSGTSFVLPFFAADAEMDISWQGQSKGTMVSFDIVLLAPEYSEELFEDLPDELQTCNDCLLQKQGWKIKAINVKTV